PSPCRHSPPQSRPYPPRFRSPVTPAEKAVYRDALFGPLPPDTLVLGSIGGTDHNKGWHLLVQAAGRLPESLRARLRLVIAGDPPDRKSTRLNSSHVKTSYAVF